MNDKEFSPAPAEFSPPRPEFSAPPREWAAPGNEISRDDTAPPQKKRRSFPAMLVAGAAAVAIGLSCWGAAVTDNTPRAALTAEQCAYLDAVSEALLEEDIPGLEALALDPMMRQLCEEVIEPYYYDVLLPYDASYSDMVREDELYTYYRDTIMTGKRWGPLSMRWMSLSWGETCISGTASMRVEIPLLIGMIRHGGILKGTAMNIPTTGLNATVGRRALTIWNSIHTHGTGHMRTE